MIQFVDSLSENELFLATLNGARGFADQKAVYRHHPEEDRFDEN